MATYHCSVKNGKIGSGLAHANYILREEQYSTGNRKEELVYKENGNLPDWAENSPQEFWRNADKYERGNARVYSEFELALPNELSHEENILLVQEFIKEHVGENKVYTFAIHEKNATLNPEVKQPHAHIMFSERIMDGHNRNEEQFFKRFNGKNINRGGCKKDDRFSDSCGTGNILKIRKSWEVYLNKSLIRYGIQVDCSSLKKQYEKAVLENDKEKMLFLDRPATKKLGPKLSHEIITEMKKSEKEKAKFIKNAPEKVQLHFIQREMKKLQEEMIALSREEMSFEHNQNEVKEIVNKIEKEVAIKQVDKNQLVQIIGEHIVGIDRQINDEKNVLSKVRRDSLTSNRILMIAQSVYTRGASKQVTKEFNDLKRIRAKYTSEFEVFKSRPKPGLFEFAKNAEYKKDVQKFEKWNHDILLREQVNNKKIEELKMVLATPAAQTKVKDMVQAITNRNEIRLKRIDGYKAEIKKLITQKNQLIKLRKVVRLSTNKIPIAGDFSKDNLIQQSSKITNQLRKSVNVPEARAVGGINARIREELEGYEGYER